MVDLGGLAAPLSLSAADFTFKAGNGGSPSSWSNAPAPTVSVRQGAGVGGSARITLTWPDGTLVNQWVQVTVKGNANTGLIAPDVFYFGNLVGDVGDNNGDSSALVSAT